MEVDFSDDVPEFKIVTHPLSDEVIEERLVRILEASMASSLNQIGIDDIRRLKAIYRRGSASFDHLHLVGVSRMQLGIARVIHVLGTSTFSSKVLDYDLVHNDENCGSWYRDEAAKEVFFKYDDEDLALAKVKLTEAGIQENSRDLSINLEK